MPNWTPGITSPVPRDRADAAITWLAEQLDAHLDLHRDRSAEPDTADELMVRSTA